MSTCWPLLIRTECWIIREIPEATHELAVSAHGRFQEHRAAL